MVLLVLSVRPHCRGRVVRRPRGGPGVAPPAVPGRAGGRPGGRSGGHAATTWMECQPVEPEERRGPRLGLYLAVGAGGATVIEQGRRGSRAAPTGATGRRRPRGELGLDPVLLVDPDLDRGDAPVCAQATPAMARRPAGNSRSGAGVSIREATLIGPSGGPVALDPVGVEGVERGGLDAGQPLAGRDVAVEPGG